MPSMTLAEQRAYVRQWSETGRLMDAIRWQEVRALDDTTALRFADELIQMALAVPMPPERERSSGLVEQQAIFQRFFKQ